MPYIDVQFEMEIDRLTELVEATRARLREGRPTSGRALDALIKPLCRQTRSTKLTFFDIVRCYGSGYRNHAGRFVQAVRGAVSIAEQLAPGSLTANSMKRHLTEILARQASMRNPASMPSRSDKHLSKAHA